MKISHADYSCRSILVFYFALPRLEALVSIFVCYIDSSPSMLQTVVMNSATTLVFSFAVIFSCIIN